MEWVGGWVVALKVSQYCAKRKVNNQTSQLLLGHRVDTRAESEKHFWF